MIKNCSEETPRYSSRHIQEWRETSSSQVTLANQQIKSSKQTQAKCNGT